MKTHVMIGSASAVGLMVQIASAETINLYTPNGKNAGYARVNPRTGSVDLYYRSGKRLGYGRVAPGSKQIDLYTPNGERVRTGKPAIDQHAMEQTMTKKEQLEALSAAADKAMTGGRAPLCRTEARPGPNRGPTGGTTPGVPMNAPAFRRREGRTIKLETPPDDPDARRGISDPQGRPMDQRATDQAPADPQGVTRARIARLAAARLVQLAIPHGLRATILVTALKAHGFPTRHDRAVSQVPWLRRDDQPSHHHREGARVPRFDRPGEVRRRLPLAFLAHF